MSFRPGKSRTFKKTTDAEESRRKREEVTVELRKTKREEALRAHRRKTDPSDIKLSVSPRHQRQEVLERVRLSVEGLLMFIRTDYS
jgi:hypothetical protein